MMTIMELPKNQSWYFAITVVNIGKTCSWHPCCPSLSCFMLKAHLYYSDIYQDSLNIFKVPFLCSKSSNKHTVTQHDTQHQSSHRYTWLTAFPPSLSELLQGCITITQPNHLQAPALYIPYHLFLHTTRSQSATCTLHNSNGNESKCLQMEV